MTDRPTNNLLERFQNQADAMDTPGGWASPVPILSAVPSDHEGMILAGWEMFARNESPDGMYASYAICRAIREHPDAINLHWQRCLEHWLNNEPYSF